MSNRDSLWLRLSYRYGNLSSKLYWKVRLILRSVYASTTKKASRALAHQLEEENKATRSLRSENLSLLKAIQIHQGNLQPDQPKELTDLKSRFYNLEKKNSKLQKMVDQLLSERSIQVAEDGVFARIKADYYKTKNGKLQEKIKQLATSGSADRNTQRIKFIKSFGAAPLFLALDNVLYANAHKVTLNAEFTHVIAHDVLGIGAARAMSQTFKAKFWVDLVEDMRLQERTGEHYRRSMTSEDISLLNSFIQAAVLSADKVINIGPWQQQRMEDSLLGRSILLPNYRDAYIPSPDMKKRVSETLTQRNIHGSYICIPNNIRSIKEITPIVNALAEIGSGQNVLHIGPVLNANLTQDIQTHLKGTGIVFNELGQCNYDDYRAILSGAEFAVIANSINVVNARFAYPNRLFDCVSSACPILTYGFDQVADFVHEHKIGHVLDDAENKEHCVTAVKKMMQQRGIFVENLRAIQDSFGWTDRALEVFESIPENSKVLIMSRKDLKSNIRIQQICRTLREKKCSVLVIGGHQTRYSVDGMMKTVPLTRFLTADDLLQTV